MNNFHSPDVFRLGVEQISLSYMLNSKRGRGYPVKSGPRRHVFVDGVKEKPLRLETEGDTVTGNLL